MNISNDKVNIFLTGSYNSTSIIDTFRDLLPSKKFNVLHCEKTDAVSENKSKGLMLRSDLVIHTINPGSTFKETEDLFQAYKNMDNSIIYFTNDDNMGRSFESSVYFTYRSIINQFKVNNCKIFYDLQPLVEYLSGLDKSNFIKNDSGMYLLNYYNIHRVNDTSGIITNFVSVFLEKRSYAVEVLKNLIIEGKDFTFFLFKEGVSYKDMRDNTNVKWQEEKEQILEEAKVLAKKALEEKALEVANEINGNKKEKNSGKKKKVK